MTGPAHLPAGAEPAAWNPDDLTGLVDAITARRTRLIAVARFSAPVEVLRVALAERGLRVRSVRCTPYPGTPLLHAAGRVRVDVLLVRDAQWLDRHSVAAIAALARDPHAGVVCVCLATAPVPPAIHATLRRLERDGLVRVIIPRPLRTGQLAAIVTATLGARPDAALTGRLRAETGGCGQALPDALAGYQRAGAIRLLGQRAYLVPPVHPPVLPGGHPLIRAARLGREVWSVARAATVLHPLGPAMPALIAAALDLAESEVLESLEVLRDAEVLRRAAGRWRFRVPIVAATIRAGLGPYEAQRLAGIAVAALWHGTASCADPGYVADLIAGAGPLVDRERARAELLAHAEAAADEPGSARWLLAAADLAPDESGRAALLARHAVRCCHHGDYADSVSSARRVLREHRTDLPAGVLAEVTHALVLATHALGADHSDGTDGTDGTVGTATAMLARGRVRDARALLDGTAARWRPVAPYLGRLLLATAQVATGAGQQAVRTLATAARHIAPDDAERHMAVLHTRLVPMLLAGDSDDVEKLLIAEGVPVERLAAPVRAVLALRQGRLPEGDDLIRRSVAGGGARYDPAYTMAHQWTATLMAAGGELTSARALLAGARAAGLAWPHLLEAGMASIDGAFGDYRQARQHLRRGLVDAAARGIVLETDQLWAELAETEFRLGEVAEAQRCGAVATRLAADRGSAGATLRSLVARAIVDGDGQVAEAVLRLAGERDQPFELARVIGKLAAHGLGDPALLIRAYHLLDGSEALLYREWLRILMRRNGIQVPDRAAAMAEGERLLAVLVADGLGPQQLATVLRTTERGVRGRLRRLFARPDAAPNRPPAW